jgi:hypothetical protein
MCGLYYLTLFDIKYDTHTLILDDANCCTPNYQILLPEGLDT